MFQMRMADLVMEIHHRYAYIEKQCKAWRCPDSDKQPDMIIKVTDDEIRREQEESSFDASPEYCESICIYRAISGKLTAFSAFVMHGAVLDWMERHMFLRLRAVWGRQRTQSSG